MSSNTKNKKLNRISSIRWMLMLYDAVVTFIVAFILIYFFLLKQEPIILIHVGVIVASTILLRTAWLIYSQVWRYGGVSCYLRLLLADASVGILIYFLEWLVDLIPNAGKLGFFEIAAIVGLNLAISLGMRFIYHYAYKNMRREGKAFDILRLALRLFAGIKPEKQTIVDVQTTKIAIIGAGRTGCSLAEEISNNIYSGYEVKCFVDNTKDKIGRIISNIKVYDESSISKDDLDALGVQEIIFAMPKLDSEVKAKLYSKYKEMGYKLRVYDYPYMSTASKDNKKTLREFDIEELLFREVNKIEDSGVSKYYKDKIVMITGGGGSIGSEMARQVAKMSPKLILLVDIYENGAYDVQQELRLQYGDNLTVKVEILSVTNKIYLEKLFKRYNVDVVIHAAAHKHVPLMERNAVEAISNNVFGTLNVVDLSYRYKVQHFIMVSTDKAVNPTNVMGATKRMCEMIVQAYSTIKDSNTIFSATRFGNVLGSAGSVIPLFKKQIANGGPITLTDRRIIRYFMTIPEAASLVLESGFMAKNGELFVLDMGKPIKILDLAENMIKLSGYRPDIDIKIEEIGLRPGEKLFEELLIKTENLDKTSNKKIFIEKDNPINMDELNEKLAVLKSSVDSNTNATAREALLKVVPTFKPADEVNLFADTSEEMLEASK